MIIDATANPLMISASATGNVKKYQIIIGGILLTILPISYLVLKLGAAPWSVFLVHLIVCCIAYITRLFIIRPLIQLRIRKFTYEVIFRCMLVAVLAIVIPTIMHIYMNKSIETSLSIIATSVILALLSSFYVGLDKHEREAIQEKAMIFINKFRRL